MIGNQFGGLNIPSPGFGTLRIDEGHVAESVETALEIGYRHIDAGQMYDNQEAVGEGIAKSSVPREDVFLATKVLHPYLRDEADYDQTIEDAHTCLDELGVDSVDLLYFHWPDDFNLEVAFNALGDLADEGVYDHLGVCNFTPELLDEARDLASDPIEVHQVEMHPLLQQDELQEYCRDNDIALVAYAPLVRGTAPELPELQEIAEKHGVSEAQVSLAYVMAKGAIPIPKATSEDHIRENWEAQTLELDDEDFRKIDAIDREERQVDPDFAVW